MPRTALPTTRYLLTLLLLLLSASVQAQLQWPAPPLLMGSTRDLIEHLVHVAQIRAVKGEPLRAPEAVFRFYEARDYQPAWVDRNGLLLAAGDLLQVLRQADTEGLVPEDYHVAAIRHGLFDPLDDALDLARLDLLLTDAFLAYCHDVRDGRVDPRLLDAGGLPHRAEADLPALLERVLQQHALSSTLAGMPPPQAGYRQLRTALARYRALQLSGGWPKVPAGAILRGGERDPRVPLLRQRLAATGDLASAQAAEPERFDAAVAAALRHFQQRLGLQADGRLGPETVAALNVGVAQRVEQIRLNMERWRWLPRRLGGRYVEVNMAAFQLRLYEADKAVMRMRVIIGRDYRQTPVFGSRISSVIFNPYWYVPQTIFQKDILPKLRQDPAYLQKERLEVFSSLKGNGVEVDPKSIDWSKVDPDHFPYTLRQGPGPDNSLGRIKFILPNPYGIYLHDTPHRYLFDRSVRAFSSGCIRLQRPLALATEVLQGAPGWDRKAVEAAIARGTPHQVALAQPLPVYLVYLTAWVGNGGGVAFRDDIYGRDKRLAQLMQPTLSRLSRE